MSFTTRKKTAIIWVSAFLMVSCSVLIMGTKASRRAKTLALRNATDSLMLLVELASESGDDYAEDKAALFVELLRTYAGHMERRDSYWLFRFPPFSKKNAVKELERAAKYLKKADQTNACEAIDKASKSLAQFLNESKPFTDDPIITFEPELISEEIQNAIVESLNDAHEKVERYAKEVRTVNDAKTTCMANRKAIVHLYLARFGYHEIVEQEKLRRFRTDLNRTINYNQLLQQPDNIDISEKERSQLSEYSTSEIRRLRLLQAIMNNDNEQAQLLLQEEVIKAVPDIQFSTVDN